MRIILHIWRQANPEARGRMVRYEVPNVNEHMSFLEMLDVLNEDLIAKGEDPVAFDHDCREGICGMCGCMVNGVAHGPLPGTTLCQLHMRHFKDGDELYLEPWRARAPRLEVQLVTVLEVPHVELAERGAGQRPVRDSIDHAAAHAANALAAIVVERHRVFAFGDQVLVEHVEHFEKRHVLIDIRDLVPHHAAASLRVRLPPDVENDSHYL